MSQIYVKTTILLVGIITHCFAADPHEDFRSIYTLVHQTKIVKTCHEDMGVDPNRTATDFITQYPELNTLELLEQLNDIYHINDHFVSNHSINNVSQKNKEYLEIVFGDMELQSSIKN